MALINKMVGKVMTSIQAKKKKVMTSITERTYTSYIINHVGPISLPTRPTSEHNPNFTPNFSNVLNAKKKNFYLFYFFGKKGLVLSLHANFLY